MTQQAASGTEENVLGAATSAMPPQGEAQDSDAGGLRGRLVGELQTLVAHAQELMDITRSVSGDGVARVREQLRQSLDSAGTTLERLRADAMERGREMAQRTDTYVHENPWQVIAVGAVAGLALGVAASSLMRSGSSGSRTPSSTRTGSSSSRRTH